MGAPPPAPGFCALTAQTEGLTKDENEVRVRAASEGHRPRPRFGPPGWRSGRVPALPYPPPGHWVPRFPESVPVFRRGAGNRDRELRPLQVARWVSW
jgi:hypothetical protein